MPLNKLLPKVKSQIMMHNKPSGHAMRRAEATLLLKEGSKFWLAPGFIVISISPLVTRDPMGRII
jgi:hypothetical protein